VVEGAAETADKNLKKSGNNCSGTLLLNDNVNITADSTLLLYIDDIYLSFNV